MYKIPHFTETEQENVIAFIKEHPFVTLIGNDGVDSVASQVPVLITEEDGKLVLRGHMMRKTDHQLAFEKNQQVLVLFTGAHCYVSASWYSERGIGGSWNYITVHARGSIEMYGDEDTLAILTTLTHRFEDGGKKPELVENMTDAYINAHIKAITGFKIVIDSMDPIFKLSQNRDDPSYQTIVKELRATGDQDAGIIAEEMVKRRPGLF
jgi:transcriptional regulator